MDIDTILTVAEKTGVLAIDTETTGVELHDNVFGVSLSAGDLDGYWDIRQQPEIVDRLKKFFKHWGGITVGHNFQFDAYMLNKKGVDICVNPLDTMVMAQLVNEHFKSYSLDFLSMHFLGAKKDDSVYEKLASLFGGKATRNVQMKNIHKAPAEIVAPYAKRDTRLTLELYHVLMKEIKNQKLEKIFDLERRVTDMLVRLKIQGVPVSVELAKQNIERIGPALAEKEKELEKLVGKINVNSSVQVKKLFDFEKDQWGEWYVRDGDRLIKLEKTKSGGPSLNSPVLSSMDHPAAKLIVDIRSLMKTRDTFLQKYIIDGSYNGKLHPTWNQCLDTGRISIRDPSLQNIPSRNKFAAEMVRSCFFPDDGHVWVEGDLSSNEVRIFAHLVAKFNPRLQMEYQRNQHLDLHQFVADLTGLPRNPPRSGMPNAKQLNLSAIFNQGNGRIAESMGLPWEWAEWTDDRGKTHRYKKAGPEAMKIIDRYHQAVPGVRELQQRAKEVALRYGYVRTEAGRKLRIPPDKAYKASGVLIQATAADLNKMTLLYMHEKVLPKYGGQLLINIHDSYSLGLSPDVAAEAFNEIAQEINTPKHLPPTRVPLILELTGIGKNWWDAYNGNNVLEEA